MKILIVSCLSFFGMLATAVVPARAYLVKGFPANDGNFAMERENVFDSNWEHAFVIYDNIDNPSSKNNDGKLVYPRSGRFVPVHIVPTNPRIVLIIQGPMALEDHLNRLLYANLRLKLLVEDYATLLKESSDILDGELRSPQPIYSMLASMGGNYLSGVAKGEASVNDLKSAMEREYRNSIEPSTGGRSSEGVEGGIGLSGGREFVLPIDMGAHSGSGEKRSANAPNRRISSDETMNPLMKNRLSTRNDFVAKEREPEPSEISSQLSRALKFAQAALRFFLEHKFETLVFVFVILGSICLMKSDPTK